MLRQLINEPNKAVPTDGELDLHLDLGFRACNDSLGYYWLTKTDLALVANQQEYALPADFVQLRWLTVGGGPPLAQLDQDEYLLRGTEWESEAAGVPKQFVVYGANLILRPKPNAAAAGMAVRLRYNATPPSVRGVTETEPQQLFEQHHDLPVLYAVVSFSGARPTGEASKLRAATFTDLYKTRVEAAQSVYEGRRLAR